MTSKNQAERDRRGRSLTAPAILSYGFRPFFLVASVYALIALPLWLWMLQSGMAPAGPFAGVAWHAHEMVFGYLGAVIAGFILTAVPNWTGRLPLSGLPLAILVGLWVVGRVATATVADPSAALALDLAFPVFLVGAIWREVVTGRNWRNVPIVLMLSLFALANVLDHLDASGGLTDGAGMRLALGVAAMLIALVGGRIVPSFTRNWLAKRESEALPSAFGRSDLAALIGTAVALVAWIVAPDLNLTGILLLLAGALLLFRLARWRGPDTWREPMVLVLHVGYLWLALALLALGLSILRADLVPASAALHSLTAGAIGTMTLAVMTRATLGHTGHAISADGWTVALYAAVVLGAILRVAASFLPTYYLDLLIAGGCVWSAAFALFVLRYGPMLVTRR